MIVLLQVFYSTMRTDSSDTIEPLSTKVWDLETKLFFVFLLFFLFKGRKIGRVFLTKLIKLILAAGGNPSFISSPFHLEEATTQARNHTVSPNPLNGRDKNLSIIIKGATQKQQTGILRTQKWWKDLSRFVSMVQDGEECVM